jgi:NAD(P)-dependent dehydrogenase (short-subunit alcohol dehydrogenase family)
MLIEKSKLSRDILSGKIILITGAGGGIGFEAARALAYLGAQIIIAEIDKDKGSHAQNIINNELGCNHVTFFAIDLADEKQIDALYDFVKEKYGFLDVLFNNAAITPMGAVDSVCITDWDKSYAVNLKAPVLLTQKFLPWMKERNSGIVAFVSSSGAAPYMGAYEVFKTAQVELANTLSGELEETNIITYSIGPGLVKTETAQKCIETVSALMGMTLGEFYEMNEKNILDAESAGVGFALSVVNAQKYRGMEIGSIQALMDAGVFESQTDTSHTDISAIDTQALSLHIKSIVNTFNEQYSGWLQRNLFERQWVLRDFKKTVAMPADAFQKLMSSILDLSEAGNFTAVVEHKPSFEKLKEYYTRQHKLLQNYEKNPEKLKENSQVILNWISELQAAISML